MKSLKSKLIASTAMLLVAAIMLTSSSFAWYTISTKGDVEDIKMSMSATTNLEIARATDKTTEPSEVALGDADVTPASASEAHWGSKVTTFDGGSVEFPVNVENGDFKTVEFDASGRAKTNLQTIPTASISDTGVTNGQTSLQSYISGISKNDNDKYKFAAVYYVWLRSNVAAEVKAATTGTPTFKDSDNNKISDLSASDVQISVEPNGGSKTALNGTEQSIGLTLTPDTPKLVAIYLSIKGDNIKASMVDKGITVEGLNVSFTAPDNVSGIAGH